MYILFLSLLAIASGNTFDKLYSWKQVDFQFPNKNIRKAFIKSGDYIEENNLPLGLAVSQDRMIITVPRWKNGVAANLNYVWLNDTQESPILIPYPDFETNNINLPDSIVNIFRVRIDECNRLWGVDTGITDIYGNNTVLKPTRIIVIDLKTDKIIRKYTLNDSDQKHNSFIADLIVDVNPDACEDAYAYLSDFSGYGLVVYSWAKNNSWRIEHNYFSFDPLHGDYNISGYNFQWTDGLFGLALTPFQNDGYRTLYFHAMSSITEFYVSTEVLQDDTLNLSNNYYAYHIAGNKGPQSQGPSSVIDQKTQIAYFTQVNKNGISCWDTNVKLTPETFILIGQDNETMVYPNDLAIDSDSRKLYVLSDNLPKFEHSDLNKRNMSLIGTGAVAAGSYLYSSLYCRYTECCTDDYVSLNVGLLNEHIKNKLYGQHIAHKTIINALRGYLNHHEKEKALTLSFHGPPGTGKNYMVKLIVDTLYKKGSDSQFFHFYNGRSDFPLKSEVENYQKQLLQSIKNALKACPTSLFVFDEVDKMPEGLLNAIVPFLDYNSWTRDTKNKGIFIFLSNTGSRQIVQTLLKLWDEGVKRDDTKLQDFEYLISIGAFNEKGGFHLSDTIETNVIDHYIPFLPLEVEHVEKCVKTAFKSRGIQPTTEMIKETLSHIIFDPPPYYLYSKAGCKRIQQKVATIIYSLKQ
ncbi:hypothetical protein M0802_004272 [Mischocyttarus mexicanus]|nr:hypothetical protein M0802_004272 [Mischocyttarus mexicanus]